MRIKMVEPLRRRCRPRDGIYSAVLSPTSVIQAGEETGGWIRRGGEKGGSVPDAVLSVGRQAPRE